MTASHNCSSCNDGFVHECFGDLGYKMKGSEPTYSTLHPAKTYLNIYDESLSLTVGSILHLMVRYVLQETTGAGWGSA